MNSIGLFVALALIPNQGEESKNVAFETIARGMVSGQKDEKQTVITSGDDWIALWEKHVRDTLPAPRVPAVDFEKEAVVVASMGEKPTSGYEIEIVRVEETKDAVVVRVLRKTPPPDAVTLQVITVPHHLIRIPKPTKPVRFVDAKPAK